MCSMSDYPKVLIQNGKHGDTVILCLNEDREKEAWLAMFHAMDQWTGYYDSFMEEPDEIELRDRAREGCWRSARDLLYMRDQHEYEGIDIQSVAGPRDLFKQLDIEKCDKCQTFLPKDQMRNYPGCIVTSELPGWVCKACDPLEKRDET